jgi:hypothetical protein
MISVVILKLSFKMMGGIWKILGDERKFFFSAEIRFHIAKISASLTSAIDEHGLGENIGTPQAKFKTLVNKNAIKHEIG